MSALLRRVAEDASVPPLDGASEAALLGAFDVAQRRRSSPRHWFLYATAAAAVLAVATTALVQHRQPARLAVVVKTSAPPIVAAPPAPIVAAGEPPREIAAKPIRPRRTAAAKATASGSDASFIVWPGAGDLPAFESGQLMRVQLPASVALSLGLVPSARATIVQADVLVGQDGFARAVRLAP